MGAPRVSIIVVTHNNRQDIQACLEAALRSGDVSLEVIVADNASTDGTPELVRQAFPAVRLVEQAVNLGFAAANNRAVRLAQGDFVLLLNADAVVAPEAIAILASRMASDPQIGVLAPKMLFLQEPTVINSIGLQSNRILYSCDRGFLEYDQGQYDAEADVIGACGGAMFLRRAVSERIGLFDTRYFMYYEDLDFCLRTWVAGYRVLTVPQAVVYHRMRAYGRSERLNEYVDHRNRLRTMLKNLSLASLRHALPQSLAFDLAGLAGHLRQGRWNAARWRVQALLWNLVLLPDTLAWRAGAQRRRAAPDDVFLRLLDKGRGYPQINAPLPSFQPAFAAALEPATLQSSIEPGQQEAEAQLGLGWHGMEDWEGLPVRWTSRYAIAFLPKTWEGPGYLTIRYFAPLNASGQVLINDRPLCRFSGTFDQWETLQAETDAKPGVVKVTLLLDRALNPRRDFGARDDRILGIAVSSIAIVRMAQVL